VSAPDGRRVLEHEPAAAGRVREPGAAAAGGCLTIVGSRRPDRVGPPGHTSRRSNSRRFPSTSGATCSSTRWSASGCGPARRPAVSRQTGGNGTTTRHNPIGSVQGGLSATSLGTPRQRQDRRGWPAPRPRRPVRLPQRPGREHLDAGDPMISVDIKKKEHTRTACVDYRQALMLYVAPRSPGLAQWPCVKLARTASTCENGL
jgi:hypothetical protein